MRLVQIDTPEVYFGTECYGRQASATTKRLLLGAVRPGRFLLVEQPRRSEHSTDCNQRQRSDSATIANASRWLVLSHGVR